jgi:hypothetical protein
MACATAPASSRSAGGKYPALMSLLTISREAARSAERTMSFIIVMIVRYLNPRSPEIVERNPQPIPAARAGLRKNIKRPSERQNP